VWLGVRKSKDFGLRNRGLGVRIPPGVMTYGDAILVMHQMMHQTPTGVPGFFVGMMMAISLSTTIGGTTQRATRFSRAHWKDFNWRECVVFQKVATSALAVLYSEPIPR
jgi:hypothetical protein